MPYVRKCPPDTPKKCVGCGQEYLSSTYQQRYCTINCKRQVHRTTGCETTARQYSLVSGNWEKYFNRLIASKRQRRGVLTTNECLDLLKVQDYKCAVSGVPLTCELVKGTVCRTNASIDRIDPKGSYIIENVQLVCVALNKLRVDMELPEFIDWCKKVANYAIR